jgi:predicted nucleic acid-binding protein
MIDEGRNFIAERYARGVKCVKADASAFVNEHRIQLVRPKTSAVEGVHWAHELRNDNSELEHDDASHGWHMAMKPKGR